MTDRVREFFPTFPILTKLTENIQDGAKARVSTLPILIKLAENLSDTGTYKTQPGDGHFQPAQQGHHALTSKVDGAGEERHTHDEQQQGRALPGAALTQLLLHAVAGRAELGVVRVVVGGRVRPGWHAGHTELRVVGPETEETEPCCVAGLKRRA